MDSANCGHMLFNDRNNDHELLEYMGKMNKLDLELWTGRGPAIHDSYQLLLHYL